MTAPDQTNAEVSDERLREKLSKRVAAYESGPPDKDAPYSRKAIQNAEDKRFLELLTRRSVTSQASEGEGWKLVPVEPTPEMANAGRRAFPKLLLNIMASTIYRVMLAAAPDASPSKRVERLEAERDEAVAMADAYKTLLYSDEVFVGTHWEGDFRDPATKSWPTLCMHFPNYGADAEEIPPDQILTVAQLVRDHGPDAILAWACHHRGVDDVVKGHLSAKAREIFQALGDRS